MASSPRTGRSSTALVALVIGAVLILGVVIAVTQGFDPLRTGEGIASSFFPPIAVTDRGAHIRTLYDIVFAIAIVIFVVVEGLIIWTVIRYRRKPGDTELPPQTHGNAIAEVVWTVVPSLIVAFMFVVSWQTLNTVEAVSPQPTLKVRALAAQFLWTFEYLPPDFDPVEQPPKEPVLTVTTPTAPDGGLVLPAGRTVQLYLESPDVIHAFYVPQFLFKRDVVPGRINTFEFTIDENDAGGVFHGQCAELCGVSHNAMHFDVVAKTGPEFDAWLADAIAKANASPPPPPSGQPAPSGEPGASGPPAGAAPLQLAAHNVQFSTATLQAPADTLFTIDFDNQDAGIPHNVAIHKGSPTGDEVFKGEIFPGVKKTQYQVPPLAAGTYAFVCSVHPTMTGTLTVQ
jgi:cytochrome c oxidase subunit 2